MFTYPEVSYNFKIINGEIKNSIGFKMFKEKY